MRAILTMLIAEGIVDSELLKERIETYLENDLITKDDAADCLSIIDKISQS